MGTVIHKATIVTSFSQEATGLAHDEAVRIFPAGMVTDMLISPINAYASFAILTCGSKLGWVDDAVDTANRATFAAWIASQAYEDGSSPFEVATVEYGSDREAAP
jgi:hypothetical protein